MKNNDLFKSFIKLIIPDYNDIIDLTHDPKDIVLDYIVNNYDSFKLCCCCDTLILKNNVFCPYCKAYRFDEINEDFVLKMNEDSKHIDYMVWLK